MKAAETGTIIVFGFLVVLDHGGGWTTYYAHLDSTAVRCGQEVNRDGIIGHVGATGKVTGPHLHFEMRWNHVPDNATAYIGF